MIITFSTASLLLYPLSVVFALASEAGFDGVELAVSPEVILRGASHVRRLSERYELPVVSVHPPMNRYPGWWTEGAAMIRSVDLANELSARVVTFHGPSAQSLMDFDNDWGRRWQEDTQRAAVRCRPGLQIGMENHARQGRHPPSPVPVASDPRQWDQFLHRNNIGITLDTAHVGSVGLDLLSVARAARPRLVNVHLSNYLHRQLPIYRPILDSLLSQHQLLHRGALPLTELLGHLANSGFPGPVTLELSPVALRFWNPRNARALLQETVRFCRQSAVAAH